MLLQLEILGEKFIILWQIGMPVNQVYLNCYHTKIETPASHLKIFVYFSNWLRLILKRALVLFFCKGFCSAVKIRIMSWYCICLFDEIQTLLDTRVCTSVNHKLNVIHVWTGLVQENAHAIGKSTIFLSIFSSSFSFKEMLDN